MPHTLCDRVAASGGRAIGEGGGPGNEGAGVVVAAGAEAGHPIGKTVAALHLGMFGQYLTLPASGLLVVPDAMDARASASQPLT